MKKLMALTAALVLVGCSSSEPEVDQMTMLEEKVVSVEQTVNTTNREVMELKSEAAALNQRLDTVDSTLNQIKGAMNE